MLLQLYALLCNKTMLYCLDGGSYDKKIFINIIDIAYKHIWIC